MGGDTTTSSAELYAARLAHKAGIHTKAQLQVARDIYAEAFGADDNPEVLAALINAVARNAASVLRTGS